MFQISLKNINKTFYLLGKRSSGLTATYLTSIPFYEFMEYTILLNEELKAEAEESQKQKQEMNSSLGKTPKLPNYKNKFK